jgi:hypothetical protein
MEERNGAISDEYKLIVAKPAGTVLIIMKNGIHGIAP